MNGQSLSTPGFGAVGGVGLHTQSLQYGFPQNGQRAFAQVPVNARKKSVQVRAPFPVASESGLAGTIPTMQAPGRAPPQSVLQSLPSLSPNPFAAFDGGISISPRGSQMGGVQNAAGAMPDLGGGSFSLMRMGSMHENFLQSRVSEGRTNPSSEVRTIDPESFFH